MKEITKTEYRYRIGGVTFSLSAPEFSEPEELRVFRSTAEPEVFFDVSFADLAGVPSGNGRVFCDERGGGVYVTETVSGSRHGILVDNSYRELFGAALVLKILDLPGELLRRGGIFLHASFVSAKGGAVLFTGKKQIGKSTQAALWEKYRGAETVNGDRALLRKENGVWRAWGSPYCGTSGICKSADLPVRAVVLLSQAKCSSADIASGREALAALLDGCSYDTGDKRQTERLLDICGEIIASVPFYKLSCLPDESAVRALENML